MFNQNDDHKNNTFFTKLIPGPANISICTGNEKSFKFSGNGTANIGGSWKYFSFLANILKFV